MDARPVLEGPPGWFGLGIGWIIIDPFDKAVTRSQAAKYTILTEFLPGPLYLHIAGELAQIRDDFKMPYRRQWNKPMQSALVDQIESYISQYANSADKLVIGPVFKPHPAEQEVRLLIHQWGENSRLGFLRPLDDQNVNLMDLERSVVPTTEFEKQVVDCLKVAIRAMIPEGESHKRFF